MTIIFNKKENKNIRRLLRKQPISAEKKLWYRLRKRQLGYRFNRQYGIGNFVVDFYCAEKKLVIEIDGSTHSTEREIKKDKEREEFFKRLNLKIVRFRNVDVYENSELVVENILNVLKEI